MSEFLQIIITSSKYHEKPSKNDPWRRRAYAKTSPWLTPYYSYRAFAMQEICSTSHLKISPERPAAGNTCASMEILRIFKMIGFHQKFEIFPEAPGSLKLMFYDVFDVLEVLRSSLNDFRSILDRSFFHHFLSNFDPEMSNL